MAIIKTIFCATQDDDSIIIIIIIIINGESSAGDDYDGDEANAMLSAGRCERRGDAAAADSP